MTFDQLYRTNRIYTFSHNSIYRINNSFHISLTNTNFDIRDPERFYGIVDIDISENEDIGTLYLLLNDRIEQEHFSIWKIKDIEQDFITPLILEKYDLTIPDGIVLNSILISDIDNNIALLGTNIGLYTVDLTEGILSPEVDIPAVAITELSYSNQLNKIHISTYGRGIWTAEFKQIISNVTNPNNIENNVNVYPNPVRDKLYIESSHTDNFKLISIQGIEIMNFKINANQTFSKDIKDLPDGIYWLIGSESGISKKVIKI